MFCVRQARIADSSAIAQIEVETWQSTYPGMLSSNTLVGMSTDRQARVWRHVVGRWPASVWLAETDDGQPLGFGHCGRQRDRAVACDGEIYMLYVLPDAQGMGVGRQLLLTQFAHLVDCGMRSAVIWVLKANPSRFFYERLGGRLVMTRLTPCGGQWLDTLGYAWPDLSAVLSAAARHGSDGNRPR